MTEDSLRKIWAFLGAVLTYYTVSAWIHSQGGGMLFSAGLIDLRPIPNAYFSVIVIGFLGTVLFIVGARHANLKRLGGAEPGLGRLPVSGIDDVDTRKWDGRVFQGFFLLFFVVVPLAGQVHFWDKLTSHASIFSQPENDPFVASQESRFGDSWFAVSGRTQDYCLASADSGAVLPQGNPCKSVPDTDLGGVEWLPTWSPIMLALGTAAAWLSALLLAVQLLR